jgi:hypothetical protein
MKDGPKSPQKQLLFRTINKGGFLLFFALVVIGSTTRRDDAWKPTLHTIHTGVLHEPI